MSKREIFSAFKRLQRITQRTFEGDQRALLEARNRINIEFRKEIDEKETLPEKLKVAKEVGDILKHQVVQAVKSDKNDNFELKLREETAKLDNVIFKDDAVLPKQKSRKCKPVEDSS